ncbi:MAG: sensor histidine kinase [Candidatus Planktophila sp.]
MWFRKDDTSAQKAIRPDFVLDLINHLDEDVLLIGSEDAPIYSSSGIEKLNVLREGRLLTPEISAIVRAVRRSGVAHNGKIEVPRGPIGEGTRELTLKVVALENEQMVLILISDESEAHRVHEVRRDFVANISHELKTPIGALSLLSEAVLSAKDDPEAVAKFATRMQHEAKRLTELVQEIINLSRLQDSDPLQIAEVLDIHHIIQDVVDQCQTTSEAKKIWVNVSEGPQAFVLGDKEQIKMAINNLIDNAINYSPPNTKVSVTTSIDGELVEICVADQGIGIPESDLERVFERFYRVDPARSRETGGTGLGLSIVKHVATKHGGDVRVWSAPAVGSTFALRLPLYLNSEEES